jgi:protein CpxP
MRKTILMGLGLALSVAGTAAAQQPAQEAPRPKAERQKGDGRVEGRRGGPDGFLLRGITLTDAQKEQVKQLRQSERGKFDANREQVKKQRDEVRSARERGDTAAVRAIMQRNRAEMVKAREQHMASVRNLLTAEQRIQFDKNVAELKEREQKRGERFGRGARGPGGQRGEKGGRFGR